MPVDYCVVILPMLVIIALIPSFFAGKSKKQWRLVASSLFGVFILLYVLPGWFFWLFAQAGFSEAQYQMAHFDTLGGGLFWNAIEARDQWLVKAANQGHPQAMSEAGYFSTFGSSRFLPKDLIAARKWLEAAKAAGRNSESGFERLKGEEAKSLSGN